MSGDYSRFTFDPWRDFSTVLQQQGRVQLDADWNEFAAQLARRLQAGTLDSAGRAHVAKETPDAFKIEASGGALTIGRGRFYVDGLLAENHGLTPTEWEAVLAELRGKTDTPYDKQTYYPNAPKLPAGGPHLIYLDVWQREVTHVERPELVEKAVGVDTTARLQTVWQVKVLPNAGAGATCETDLEDVPGWLPQNAHSAGRLSTSTGKLAGEPDPCIVPPSGGYKGLENQLYRIEIHDGGPAGTATFKWSRDNASVVTRVVAIPALDQLIVESIGRDDVLRFSDGDWIEMTDDVRELHGFPGELRRIKIGGVDKDTRTITLEKPLPGGLFPTDAQNKTDAARHTRIRRWDQKGKVRNSAGNEHHDLDAAASTGAIPVPVGNTSLFLESGILSAFNIDPVNGQFRSGDYWVFWARSTDATIEALDKAPPRGIHHHYAKLALVTFPDTETDCRPKSPQIEAGCCTVVVYPGENIQAALDSLPKGGGCACLKTGVHEISDTVRIARSNVVLHGESRGARVVRRNGATLLALGNPAGFLLENVAVSNIEFEFHNSEVESADLSALVILDQCDNTSIDNCAIKAQRLEVNLVGIRIGDSSDVRVSDCEVDRLGVGLWVAGDLRGLSSTGLSITDNRFSAFTSDNTDNGIVNTDGGIIAVFLQDAFGPSRIERNRIEGFFIGIALNRDLSSTGTPSSDASGSVIASNRIARFNLELPAAGNKAFAIDVAASDCVIADNTMTYAAAAHAGIGVSGSRCRIENNTLTYLAREGGGNRAVGILLGRLGEGNELTLEGGRIAGNKLSGPLDAIVITGNSGAEALNNEIEGAGARFGILLLDVDRARVEGNRVTKASFAIAANQGEANECVNNELLSGGAAMSFLNQTSLEVTENRVENMGNWGLLGMHMFGKVAVTENRFIACGYEQSPAIAIGVSEHLGELHVESCEVMNTGISPDGETTSALAWGIFADLVLECRIQSNLVTYSNAAAVDPNQEHRALWLRGFLESVTTFGSGQLVFGFSAQVLDNKFLGPGLSALVEIAQQVVTDNAFRRFERVFFNNNFCWHWSVPQDRAATISLVARSAIVMGNHIKANGPLPSVDFHNIKDAVYMGNIAQTDPINFGGIPTPVPDFNRP